jgi:peptidyl-prolyl cis-trans isomerase C
VHPSHPLRYRSFSRALIVYLVILGALAGCGRGDEPEAALEAAADTAAALPAPVGPAIDDTTYALIIAYEEGGDTLTTAFYRAQLQNYEQQLQQRQPGVMLDEAQRRRVRQGLAEEYIRRRLLLAEATRLRLTADPAEVETAIDQIVMQNRFESRQMLEEIMAEQGMTMDSLRIFLAEEVVLRMVSEQIVEATAAPTPAEITAFSREQGDEVWAQHILFSGEDEAVLQKANAVLDSAKAGADFFALARRHSEGPSGPTGGDLGYFKRDDMVAPFSEAAYTLADSGDVYPDLVKTSFGYHIIRLLGRRASAPIDTSRARLMLMQNRQRDAYEGKMRQLRADAVVRVNPQIIDAELDVAGG